MVSLVATSADSVPSSYLVRIPIAPIGTTFGNLQWRRYWNNFTFEYSSNNNIFSFVAMSADSVPSSKTNIFQSKLIYFRHFRTYSRCAMFDWSDTVFLRRNVTRRRISNTVLQPRYWGREADSPEVCRLKLVCNILQKSKSIDGCLKYFFRTFFYVNNNKLYILWYSTFTQIYTPWPNRNAVLSSRQCLLHIKKHDNNALT